MSSYVEHILREEKKVIGFFRNRFDNVTLNGDQKNKIPGLISINIPGINNELFCKQVSKELAISTGSACSIGEKSYVLDSIQINGTNTIRIKISKFFNENNLDINVLFSSVPF